MPAHGLRGYCLPRTNPFRHHTTSRPADLAGAQGWPLTAAGVEGDSHLVTPAPRSCPGNRTARRPAHGTVQPPAYGGPLRPADRLAGTPPADPPAQPAQIGR